MTITEIPPDTDLQLDEFTAIARAHARTTRRYATGIAVSIAGIAIMCALLAMYVSLGRDATVNQGLGTLLLVVPAFVLSAWGTDLRHAAHRERAIAQQRLSRAEIDARGSQPTSGA